MLYLQLEPIRFVKVSSSYLKMMSQLSAQRKKDTPPSLKINCINTAIYNKRNNDKLKKKKKQYTIKEYRSNITPVVDNRRIGSSNTDRGVLIARENN